MDKTAASRLTAFCQMLHGLSLIHILITAVPVSQEVRERIHDRASSLLHASMELQTEGDPSIEGGFIFDINDLDVYKRQDSRSACR